MMSTAMMSTAMTSTATGHPTTQASDGPAHSAPRRGQQQPATHLTRRGRFTVLLVAVALLLFAFVAWGPRGAATDAPGDPVPAHFVTVQPGETLWEIAARANPGSNVNTTVHDIADLNSLQDTGELEIGQQLAVPLY